MVDLKVISIIHSVLYVINCLSHALFYIKNNHNLIQQQSSDYAFIYNAAFIISQMKFFYILITWEHQGAVCYHSISRNNYIPHKVIDIIIYPCLEVIAGLANICYQKLWCYSLVSQTAKFMGPTWGPPGSYRPQMGPVLAPWTLLSGIPYKLLYPFTDGH